jgi:uncharacterized protein YlbG (UPF0298 family)
MSNPIEELLKKLINDPALLKNLEKMASESVKATLKETRRKRDLDRFGSIDYVNKVIKECKLCKSSSTFYSPMIWDKIEKLHRASCMSGLLCEEWSMLEVRTLRQSVPTCNCCSEVLKNIPKDDLILKLITIANRL